MGPSRNPTSTSPSQCNTGIMKLFINSGEMNYANEGKRREWREREIIGGELVVLSKSRLFVYDDVDVNGVLLSAGAR